MDRRASSPKNICRATAGRDASTAPGVGKALKEWAPVCEALGTGDQTLTFRKGGIREAHFAPRAKQFFLFPTSFHTHRGLLQGWAVEKHGQFLDYELGEKVTLSYVANITGAWTTYEGESLLERTKELHVWNEEMLYTRLRWKPSVAITVLELQVDKLSTPLVLPVVPEFKGCFSWLDVEKQIDGHEISSTAACSQDEFRRKQTLLRDALSTLEAKPLSLDQVPST